MTPDPVTTPGDLPKVPRLARLFVMVTVLGLARSTAWMRAESSATTDRVGLIWATSDGTPVGCCGTTEGSWNDTTRAAPTGPPATPSAKAAAARASNQRPLKPAEPRVGPGRA